MPKGRHTHYLRISSRMQLSSMRSRERNYDANILQYFYSQTKDTSKIANYVFKHTII